MVDCKVVSLITACMLILTHQCSHCAEIIGGKEVKPHSMPYMALLGRIKDKPDCGGILISPRCILTAAHCNNLTTAWLGVHDHTKNEASQQVTNVKLSIPHESYDGTTKVNDLRLIKLDRPVKLTKEVKYLPPNERAQEPPVGGTCVVAGWGRTSNNAKKMSNVLRSVTVTVISRTICNEAYESQITDSMICAGSVNRSNAGTCNGDSGGPLLYKGNLVGVTSFGPLHCGQEGIPGVYTFLSKNHLQWIQKQMRQHACHK